MMENEFYPPRTLGLIFHGGLILIFLSAGIFFFYHATQNPSGVNFLLDMTIALLLFAPLPLLSYRLYPLLNGVYVLGQEGLIIRWGLRREDIPLGAIEWIRPANEVGFRLPLPWLRLPGAIIGRRMVNELGLVEYLAADVKNMLLVATPNKVFALSPEDGGSFVRAFLQANELGSLMPLDAQSVYPQVFIGRVWEDRLGRVAILAGLTIGVILLLGVALAVTALGEINWLEPGSIAPAERLLLLPILNGLIWLVNLGVGSLLFRRGGNLKLAAYLLWFTSVLTGLLLVAGSLAFIF